MAATNAKKQKKKKKKRTQTPKPEGGRRNTAINVRILQVLLQSFPLPISGAILALTSPSIYVTTRSLACNATLHSVLTQI
jgi:hypothetical protein